MAKAKEKKNYVFTTADGRFNFKVLKTADGKGHSMGGVYPVIMQTEKGIQKLTRKQTEKMCVEYAATNGWFPVADGNK